MASGQPWVQLRAHVPETLYCSYETEVGDGTGTNDPLGFSFSSPDGPWYYIVATCDLDGSSASNSRYFYSSTSTKRQVQNEGR